MIYVASNLKHRDKWLNLRTKGWPISSTWIDKEKGEDYQRLWASCIDEIVSDCQVLLLYQEEGDSNNGALVELGAALAMDTSVVYVGPNYGVISALYHPNVSCFKTLDEGLAQVRTLLDELPSCED